jgi:hypothetical protein
LKGQVDPVGSGITVGPARRPDLRLRPGNVAKVIRAKLDEVKLCMLVDEYGNQVSALELVRDELNCGSPEHGTTFSEHIATFLTTRCVDSDLTSLVCACKRLYETQHKQEAGRIREILHLMLPLCLPQEVLAEAWDQLREQDTVLIRTSVRYKTGAAMVVYGLHGKPAKLKKVASELIGEQQLSFEPDPIGDPSWNVESALRELYVTSFHAEVRENERKTFAAELKPSTEEIREELRNHYRALKDREKVPCYCVVKLAPDKEDRVNRARLLNDLGIPDLLFIGLATEGGTIGFERYVMTCLNTLFEYDEKGKPA